MHKFTKLQAHLTRMKNSNILESIRLSLFGGSITESIRYLQMLNRRP